MTKDIDLELSKILAKIMENSYRKKEIEEIIYRIMEKFKKLVSSNKNEEKVKNLRLKFEEIQRNFEAVSKNNSGY